MKTHTHTDTQFYANANKYICICTCTHTRTLISLTDYTGSYIIESVVLLIANSYTAHDSCAKTLQMIQGKTTSIRILVGAQHGVSFGRPPRGASDPSLQLHRRADSTESRLRGEFHPLPFSSTLRMLVCN